MFVSLSGDREVGSTPPGRTAYPPERLSKNAIGEINECVASK